MRSLGDIGDIKATGSRANFSFEFFSKLQFLSRLYFAILHCFAQIVQLSAWILRHLQKRFWTERSHRNNFSKQRERRGFVDGERDRRRSETAEQREARNSNLTLHVYSCM